MLMSGEDIIEKLLLQGRIKIELLSPTGNYF